MTWRIFSGCLFESEETVSYCQMRLLGWTICKNWRKTFIKVKKCRNNHNRFWRCFVSMCPTLTCWIIHNQRMIALYHHLLPKSWVLKSPWFVVSVNKLVSLFIALTFRFCTSGFICDSFLLSHKNPVYTPEMVCWLWHISVGEGLNLFISGSKC